MLTESDLLHLQVDLGSSSYPIFIGSDILANPEIWTKSIKGDQVVIITNSLLADHYLARVKAALTGYQTSHIIIADDEQHKTWQTVEAVVTTLLENKINRQATLCALGGGVIGDITGFVAAIYQRGVPFIQIPTTLLAQADAAVGGKTAINHPMGKNMMGAFHQPSCVVIDCETLATLPRRQFCAGLAEVIKIGLIADAPFFDWLEKHIDNILAKDQDALQYLIAQSCRHKARIVAQDEREQGVRALLNFGHSFAHAIEVRLGYGNIEHGEAVAIGMVMAAKMSCRVSGLALMDVERLCRLLQRAKLPIFLPESLNTSEILQSMSLDKKNLTNKLRLILLKEIGQAYIYDSVDKNVLHEVICDSYV